MTWVSVPLEAFKWLAGSPAAYDSGPTCVRYFCNNCGAHVALFSRNSPQTMDITIATLDHPELTPADRHIWTDSRLPWLHLDEQLPGEREESL